MAGRGHRSHGDLDILAERPQPVRQAIEGDALHAAVQHLRQRRLVGAADLGRLLLRQGAVRHHRLHGKDQRALGGQLVRVLRAEAQVVSGGRNFPRSGG